PPESPSPVRAQAHFAEPNLRKSATTNSEPSAESSSASPQPPERLDCTPWQVTGKLGFVSRSRRDGACPVSFIRGGCARQGEAASRGSTRNSPPFTPRHPAEA